MDIDNQKILLGAFIGVTAFLSGQLLGEAGINAMEDADNSIGNSEQQEMHKVCVEKDIDFVEAYPEDSWQRLEQLPERGVLKKEDFTSVNGGIWVTLNISEANIEPPQKVKYKSVSECVEYRMVRK